MAERLTSGDISMRFSFIMGGVSRGLSANAILRELSAAGIGIQRARGLKLVSQAKQYFSAQITTAGLHYFNPVPAHAITPWASKTMTGYGHVVQVYYTPPGASAPLAQPRYYTVRSDTPLTPSQAIYAAINVYSSVEYEGLGTINYGVLSNVVQYYQSEV